MTRSPIDFEAASRRSRFEAWLLDATADRMHRQWGKRKAAVLGALTGTVIELGPGTGVNFRYYQPGVKVIGIEPNPAMHERLEAAAVRHGVDLEIRTVRGEHLDLDDASADAVVATLVLCGVDDPAQVVGEVKRVLRPGGTYFFLEHVGAADGSAMRRFQSIVNRPHSWAFNGCEVQRVTAALLAEAGFASLDIEEKSVGAAGLYTPDFIVGTASR